MKRDIIDKIPSQTIIQDIVQSSVNNLETTLKEEILKSINDIRAQISALEHQVAEKCSISDVHAEIKTLVQQETALPNTDFAQHLNCEVQRLFAEEQDRQRRALNIVAYGIPSQSDELYIQSLHLSQHYKL